jgi:hypothetical protein
MGVNMEKVINLLYDIEEKANQIVKRANEEKAKLHDQLQKQMEQVEHDMEVENSTKLEVLKIQVDKELNLEKQSLLDNCIKQLTDMEAIYWDKHNSLADKIFQEIIQS